MKREAKTFVREIDPSNYKSRRSTHKTVRDKAVHPGTGHMDMVHTNRSAYGHGPMGSSGYLLVFILALLVLGFGWFAWKYYALSEAFERLGNQVELIHQRLPLADQVTHRSQFEQSVNQRIDQVEKRLAEIIKSSNEIITMVERFTHFDLTKEVEHIQQLTSENIDKLDGLERQLELLSRQQENMMSNRRVLEFKGPVDAQQP